MQVAALAAALDSPQDVSAEVLAAAGAALWDGLKSRRDAILAHLVPGLVDLDVLDAGELAVCRDYLGAAWLPGRPSVADLGRVVQVAAVMPSSMCVGPLLLAGVVAAAVGNGVLAVGACERVLAVDPEHTLAGLVLADLEGGHRLRDLARGRV